jgi:hypothetical protein
MDKETPIRIRGSWTNSTALAIGPHAISAPGEGSGRSPLGAIVRR